MSNVKNIVVLMVGTILAVPSLSIAQARIESQFRIARLKYSGGGDWYNDPTEEVNLLKFIKENTTIDAAPGYEFVDLSSEKLFSYPFLFITGHGNIAFSEYEVQRLRSYLMNGGFLYADDDYGMDKAFRREIARVFPDHPLVEVPLSHPIYHVVFDFPKGLPKIHQHDGLPAQGFGIFLGNRLVVYYSYQTDLGDGWEDPDVHHDSPELHEAALRMGVNLFTYAVSAIR